MKSNWSVQRKLLFSFFGVAMIALILGFLGFISAWKSERAINEIGGNRFPSLESLLIIKEKAEHVRGSMRTLAIPGILSEIRERQYKNLLDARQAYEAAWKVYEPLPRVPEEEKIWKEFVPAWEAWRNENNKLVEMSKKLDRLGISDPYELARLLERFTKDHYILVQKVNDLIHLNIKFEGGEDHMACNAGKWYRGFKSDNPELMSILREFETHHKNFHAAVATIKKSCNAGAKEEAKNLYQKEMLPAMEAVFKAFGRMQSISDEAAHLFKDMQAQALGPVTEKGRAATALLDRLVRINTELVAKEVSGTHSTATFFKASMLISVIAGVILALGLGVMMGRSISNKLSRISAGLEEASTQAASASTQVSSASQSLAEGASEQAASIEETSSSLEELSSMTKRNAENANVAKQRMAEAKQIVEKVNNHMIQMAGAIEQMIKSSEETSKIIKTIDEIAFQTNLLALNAAVEAARAGEAGAGFAVVADEVRNLAMRASEAAKNTSMLIENTIKAIQTGNELVQSTQEAFKENISIASKVGELVDEIAAASNEQAQGIEQINKAVAELSKVVQQNSANAEESASSAEEMSGQAEQLRSIVDEMLTFVKGNQGEAFWGSRLRIGEVKDEDADNFMKDSKTKRGLYSIFKKGERNEKVDLKQKREKSLRDRDASKIIPLEDRDFKEIGNA